MWTFSIVLFVAFANQALSSPLSKTVPSQDNQCVGDISECVSKDLDADQYPHCYNCSLFIKCNDEASAEIECPSGLVYDSQLRVCNYPVFAKCRPMAPTTTTAAPVVEMGTSLPNMMQCLDSADLCESENMNRGQYPSCGDCGNYIQCKNVEGGSGLLTCDNSYEYDVVQGVCVMAGTAKCGNSKVTTIATTTEEVDTITLANNVDYIKLFSKCLNKLNDCVSDNLETGQYPKCSDCSKFIKCHGYSSRSFSCPSGLLYDVNEGVCGYKDQVTCGTSN